MLQLRKSAQALLLLLRLQPLRLLRLHLLRQQRLLHRLLLP